MNVVLRSEFELLLCQTGVEEDGKQCIIEMAKDTVELVSCRNLQLEFKKRLCVGTHNIDVSILNSNQLMVWTMLCILILLSWSHAVLPATEPQPEEAKLCKC